MQFLSTVGLLGTVSASAIQMSGQVASGSLFGLAERQVTVCESVPIGPDLCERSCGEGYVSCVVETMCYNPGLGQICCSDSTYCDAGTQCTDAGCCPNDLSIGECGGTVTLSVIPPTSQPTSEPEPSTSDEPDPEPEPTTTEEPTEAPEPTTEEPLIDEDTDVVPEPTRTADSTSSEPTVAPEPTTSESTSAETIDFTSSAPTSTEPSTSPPVPTGAAAMNPESAGLVVIGGLLAQLLLL